MHVDTKSEGGSGSRHGTDFSSRNSPNPEWSSFWLWLPISFHCDTMGKNTQKSYGMGSICRFTYNQWVFNYAGNIRLVYEFT